MMLTRSALALVVAACAYAGSKQSSPNADSAKLPPATSPVTLSNDATADPVVRRCLANAPGVVARFNDNEAYAAVDPKNPDRVIAVWQTQSGSRSVVQWVRSTDGGVTWTPPRAAPTNACAGGPIADAMNTSDPWATFGPDGRAYISAIAWKPNPNDGPDVVSGLVVIASADGGLTWEPPVAAAIAPSLEIAHDNLAISADPTRPATVYAATTREESKSDGSYFGRFGFTRSDDGGKTWTPIRTINPAANRERVGAPQIVVDPRSGTLYAVYRRSRTGADPVVGVMVSTDRGETWSTERIAAPHVRGAQVTHPVTGRAFALATDIVQATVSPTTGQLAIAYADARSDPGGRSGVSLVWSADGLTWSSPIAVSDGSAETAWLPAIASNARGEIAVAYLTANLTAGQSSASTRLLLQRFRPAAGSYARGERTVLDSAPLEWPGDYQGLIAIRRGFLATYSKQQDISALKQ
jgi:hypothetical protein